MTSTSQRTFGGANIKGTPAMSASSVRNDLKVLKSWLDIIALQEFKWRWYWRALAALFSTWGSFPAQAKGIAHPIQGAQGLLWKRTLVRRVASKSWPAFDFATPHAGIMDDRWIRAVCLEDIKTRIRCWYVSTHFVVKSDGSRLRSALMRQNINALDDALEWLLRAGEPVVLELDANLHHDDDWYPAFISMLERHRGTIVGQHGAEYLVIFHGEITRVVVDRHYVLTPKALGLKTDHEVRCIDHHLERLSR